MRGKRNSISRDKEGKVEAQIERKRRREKSKN